MLKITENGNALEFIWYDKKKYTIRISDGTNTLNLEELGQTWKKILEERENECKKIVQLGAGLTGDKYLANGFLLGWLVKSIKDKFEKDNDAKTNIQVDVEDIDNNEIKVSLVNNLRNLADEIENEEKDIENPSVVKGDAAGLDLF